jgi:CDP-diacylglycerol--glycerol-3-phosphate 3-phosphatidyltransferase
VLNAANIVTLFRIGLTPVFLWFLIDLYQPGQPINWVLLLAFILIAASDGLDGAIARRQNKVTKLGKILDPIADKILLGGAFIVLSLLEVAPWWATIAILAREVAITIYRLVVVKKRVIAASNSGKAKTIMQSIAVGYLISPLNLLWFNNIFDLGFGLIYGAVFLTWWSVIQYFKESR